VQFCDTGGVNHSLPPQGMLTTATETATTTNNSHNNDCSNDTNNLHQLMLQLQQ